MCWALVCAAAAAPSAELPDDARRAIETFEKKQGEILSKAESAKRKEREALKKDLQKAIERETKARHSADALAIKAHLEGLESTDAVPAKER
ncbi:MAG: hypothetical protein H0V44_13415 [Planctomycetes bacterium]|nr:hypothetical protein [Planctomycetota bacterium]